MVKSCREGCCSIRLATESPAHGTSQDGGLVPGLAVEPEQLGRVSLVMGCGARRIYHQSFQAQISRSGSGKQIASAQTKRSWCSQGPCMSSTIQDVSLSLIHVGLYSLHSGLPQP